jgi:DNA-binding MarR family transcriptional regulator
MNEEHPVPDDLQLAAWRAFINAHAAIIDRIERELAVNGLISLVWYDILVALWEAPDHRLRLNELASAIVLSRSGLSRLLDRLEAAGFVRREPCPQDRRGAFAVLTPAGRAAQLLAWPVYARGISTYFAGHLTDDEARTLSESLGRVNATARTP